MIEILRLTMWLNDYDKQLTYSATFDDKYVSISGRMKGSKSFSSLFHIDYGTKLVEVEKKLLDRMLIVKQDQYTPIEMVTITLPLESAKQKNLV